MNLGKHSVLFVGIDFFGMLISFECNVISLNDTDGKENKFIWKQYIIEIYTPRKKLI